MSLHRRLALLGLAAAVAGCAAPDRRDDWFSQDKLLHFGVAAGISAATTYYQLESDADADLARQRALLLTMTLGTGKEIYDREIQGTFFSWRDMTWNLIGALTGSYLVTALD